MFLCGSRLCPSGDPQCRLFCREPSGYVSRNSIIFTSIGAAPRETPGPKRKLTQFPVDAARDHCFVLGSCWDPMRAIACKQKHEATQASRRQLSLRIRLVFTATVAIPAVHGEPIFISDVCEREDRSASPCRAIPTRTVDDAVRVGIGICRPFQQGPRG